MEQMLLFIVKVSSGATNGESRKFLGLVVIAAHLFQQSLYIKAYFVYLILYNAWSLLSWKTTTICELYQFGFQKVLLINFGFYCVSPLKAETVKLNVIAFDMGNG